MPNMDTAWYDRECVPFAKSVAASIRETGKVGPQYELLGDLCRMVQNFSCGEGGDARDTGLRDMLRDGDFARGTNHVVTHKTQVMTKYMLLERLAVTLGCSTGDKFVVARIQSMDVIANRLQPVVRGSTQWPQDFNAIRRILAHTEDTDEPTFSGPLPEVLSDQQEAHLRKIRLLSGAARNHQKSAYHVAEGNLQYMAFIVQWHASRNIPFAKDFNEFFQELVESGARLGLPSLSSQTIGGMNDDQKKQVYADLKACLDLAVHISPLVLLHAVPGSRFNMDRGSLVKWGMALGPKPDFIRNAEGKMWGMVMDVALGKDARKALQSFVNECREDILSLEENQEALGRYFINGRFAKDSTPGPPGLGSDVYMTDLTANRAMSGAPANAARNASSSAISQEAGLIGVIEPSGNMAVDPKAPQHVLENQVDHDMVDHRFPAAGDLHGAPSPPPLPTPGDGCGSLPNKAKGKARNSDDMDISSASEEDSESPDDAGGLASHSDKKAGKQPVHATRQSSRRIITPAHKFTSGAALTNLPSSKKRRLEEGEASAGPSGPRDLLPPQKSHIFWDVTTKFVKNAVLDKVPKAEPEAQLDDDDASPMPQTPPVPTPISQASVNIKMFSEETGLPEEDYLFQPDANSGRFDIKLVRKIAAMVENRFKDGKPPHHQPEASQRTYHAGSDIFTVDCKAFNAMELSEIHEIHRDRHLLVRGVDPGRPTKFDEEGLQKLRDIDAPVQIQHSDRKTDNNSEGMLEPGKLRDLLDSSKAGSHVAQNVLDLTLGHTSAPIPVMYTEIASDTWAVTLIKHLMKIYDMGDVKSWATASTRNALSWFHTDDIGLSTVIWVQAGSKWWVFARRIKEDRGLDEASRDIITTPWADPRRDEMNDTTTFQRWKVADIDDKLWELEAVHLKPDCVLYMRPCTPHFVLGTEDSIVLGRHYYATTTIRRSCFGIVHTFVMGAGITNTSHNEDVSSLLRQLMALWYRHMVLHDGFGRAVPHVPNMQTQDGLLDVIALGCVIEFATALCRVRYADHYDPDTAEAETIHAEESQARTWFRVIMKIFATKYGTVVSGQMVHPSYIWHHCLVGFAAAVVTLMKTKARTLEPFPNGTASKVTSAFRSHLEHDHPHLLAPFNAALKEKIGNKPARTSLLWDGRAIQIFPKPRVYGKLMQAMGIPENVDSADRPLHPGGPSRAETDALNEYFQAALSE